MDAPTIPTNHSRTHATGERVLRCRMIQWDGTEERLQEIRKAIFDEFTLSPKWHPATVKADVYGPAKSLSIDIALSGWSAEEDSPPTLDGNATDVQARDWQSWGWASLPATEISRLVEGANYTRQEGRSSMVE